IGEKVTVLQATEASVTELDAGKLAGQPLIEAAIRSTVGRTFMSFGRYGEAERNFQRSLDLRRKFLPADHATIAKTLVDLAEAIERQRRRTEAEKLYREALAICRRTLPAGHP